MPKVSYCYMVTTTDPTEKTGDPTQGGLKRAADRVPHLNVRGLQVLDLRTLRPDGEYWDFTRPKDRAWALRLLREQKPRWVIAAPPCTAFSVLNRNLNFAKMTQAQVDRLLTKGCST